MSRHPDRKPKSIRDDTERLELVFKRALEDEGEVWTAAERKSILERLNPIIADFRAKCISIGIDGPRKTNGRPPSEADVRVRKVKAGGLYGRGANGKTPASRKSA